MADDTFVRHQPGRWAIGTGKVERVVVLKDGRFRLESLRDRLSARDLAAGGAAAGEISLTLNGVELTGASGGWELAGWKQTRLKQGERQVDITLRRGPVEATKHYMLYPGTSIIREWLTLANRGAEPITIQNPGFLHLTVGPGDGRAPELPSHPIAPSPPQLLWMSGGENQPGSWLLKTEELKAGKERAFDSYDPFPLPSGVGNAPGDGIDAKILLNDRQIWPSQGWQYVANANITVPFDVQADVKPGDRLSFLVNMHGNIGWDTTAFDPTITYSGGESHTASREFSDQQGRSGWQYGYVEGGRFVELVYYPDKKQWRKKQDNRTGTPFVGQGDQHPDVNQDSARVWTAAGAGRVRITGTVCNTGNRPAGSPYGFKPGTSSYAPWYALYDQAAKHGLFIGWDYFGHWQSGFTYNPDGTVTAELRVAGYKKTLQPGEFIETPRAFTGLYHDDLDNAGNEVLDWQYRYAWEYAREGWFPALRTLGYWYKGTGWGQNGVGWTGGGPDWRSTFLKVFRLADLMRYVGLDVYHRDWGWWDRAGDWNGPDFRTTGEYLRKYGMGQLIYAFLYTVDSQSQVAKEHPDWLLGATLDMSRPEVVAFMRKQLDGFVERWGDFEWRNDSFFTAPRNGDDTPLLGQDQGFRELLRGFLDAHPGCAFQAVNGGGNYTGYDYVRYASTIQFSDGAVGIIRNYWTSLLLPPDKTNDMPDIYDPNAFDKAKWRGLLCANFDTTGDTWDPVKLEGYRELADIYHYLLSQGVVGRWVHMHRPRVDGDDPTMYHERLSGDGKRAIIIPKRPAPGPITVYPKGLISRQRYLVSYQESAASERRTGADLMERGIHIEKMPPGELIYLNLPYHPGNRLDKVAPIAPSDVTKRAADNMGFPGVELTWNPGTDDRWVSYYEILRDGKPIDKVAHGTFYFDHSAGADLAADYAVRTVDGAGNKSSPSEKPGPADRIDASNRRAQIIDDAPGGGITFTGEWKHDTPSAIVAHNGTITSSNQQGAAAEVSFEGRRVLWFTKLGADRGRAAVSLDGGAPEIVDTYAADDIWGVCLYRREVPAGRHTLRIEVLGSHAGRSTGDRVYIDGIRAEVD